MQRRIDRLIVKLAHLDAAALARVLNPGRQRRPSLQTRNSGETVSSDPPLSSGADVAPALLLSSITRTIPAGTTPTPAAARLRGLALLGRGLGIAHMLSTRPGISFLASEMRSLTGELSLRSMVMPDRSDDLDLKLFAPAL